MARISAIRGSAGRRAAALFFSLGLLFLFTACPFGGGAEKKDDLALADAALDERDSGDAAMYFERYLRKNPAGEKRWDVWRQLLALTLDIRQDKKTALEYLEIMLTEFAGDPPKRRLIQMRLAAICKDLRADARAVSLWEALAADPDTPAPDRAEVYRELSQAYLRRLEFSLATEVLGLCLSLDVSSEIKANCLYALSETQMLTGELAGSEQALRELLRLKDLAEERRVLAVFMLADVLELEERLPEAADLFESIRESYPNTRVIEIRLGNLKRKNGAKTPVRGKK